MSVTNLDTQIPLNLTINFHNIEGLHSDCECFLVDITKNFNHDICIRHVMYIASPKGPTTTH